MAGDTMAFEKPVIGTIVPAPALAAILSYIPRPVKRAPKKTIVIGVKLLTCSSVKP